MSYQVELDNFTGPFALLCDLIENAELDICAVAISEVVDQYIVTVCSVLDYRDLGSITEFLVLATRLLAIKMQVLLPRTAVAEHDISQPMLEEDTEQLVEHLKQYRVFRDLGQQLGNLIEIESDYYAIQSLPMGDYMLKCQETIVDDKVKLEINDIAGVWKQILPICRQPSSMAINPDRPTVEEAITLLKNHLNNLQYPLSFRQYLGQKPEMGHLIASLLAILELWRQDRIRVWQTEQFGDIFVARREDKLCRGNH